MSKDHNGNVILALQAEGKAESKAPTAQFASFSGRLVLKEVVANDMRLGAVLTITVTDEDVNEGST